MPTKCSYVCTRQLSHREKPQRWTRSGQWGWPDGTWKWLRAETLPLIRGKDSSLFAVLPCRSTNTSPTQPITSNRIQLMFRLEGGPILEHRRKHGLEREEEEEGGVQRGATESFTIMDVPHGAPVSAGVQRLCRTLRQSACLRSSEAVAKRETEIERGRERERDLKRFGH